jgi:hypothetical protein
MTNFTQKELEDEYIKRIKRHEQYKIALIDIWKLPDGTYTDKDPNEYKPIFTYKFFITCFMIIFIGYFLWRIMA